MERSPNILLITTDQQRHDAIGYAGDGILRTANLDGLAGSGVRFSRAYVTCPVCIPARRTLLSGLHPDTHGMIAYQDGKEFNPPHTLPGCLSAAGYQTQLIGKMHLHPQGKRYGFDNIVLSEAPSHRPDSAVQKRNDYVDWLRDQGVKTDPTLHGLDANSRLARPAQLPEEFHHSTWLVRQAEEFLLKQRDPTCPWFMHLSFVAPHPPFNPPQPYWDRYVNNQNLRRTIGEWAKNVPEPEIQPEPCCATGPFDEEDMRLATAGYYALIQHIDDLIAHLLTSYFNYHSARSRDPLYIVFSSDHGEMLGDHNLFRKSLGYEASAHVPLFIAGRNVPINKGRCDALATWEDIMPTILDLAGVDIPANLDGVSLAPAVRGEDLKTRDTVYGMCYGQHSNHYLVHGYWKYIWFPATGEEQLFNLAQDPREMRDLSATEASILAGLRDIMEQRVPGTPGAHPYDRTRLTPCANRPPKIFWP